MAEVRECADRLCRVSVAAQRETVEAATAHQEQLVAQHIADRAKFAVVAQPLAQDSCIGVATPVAEDRKIDGNDGKFCQERFQILGLLIAL